MDFYITAIGSGNTLNYPHQKKYKGVLALAEKTEKHDLFYVKGKDKSDLSQDEIFYSKFKNTKYEYAKWMKIDSWLSTYEIGEQIIKKIDYLKFKFPKAKFHIEISAGYKRIGYILTLISYIRNKDITKLTFLRHNDYEDRLPIIKIDLHKKEREILEGFRNGIETGWNGKINMNKYVMTYSKDRKYIYRVLKKCKEIGLMNEKNQITDFGNLYLDYC